MNRTTIITATGVEVDLANPEGASIEIRDVAHALARVSRFGGHYRGETFYSVAAHSLAVVKILEDVTHNAGFALAGLLHDASEAYLGDVVRPLKTLLPDYVEVERRWQDAIAKRFNVAPAMLRSPEVKEADEIALGWENAIARPQSPLGPNAARSLGHRISYMRRYAYPCERSRESEADSFLLTFHRVSP